MLKDKYKDPNILPKVNMADVTGAMNAIKEYLRSCCGVTLVPLAYFIMKTIMIHAYGDYPKYAIPMMTSPGCYTYL